MTIQEKLKDIRARNNISQSELAEKLNVSQNAIHNWETGKRQLSVKMLKLISKTFNIPIIELIECDFG